MINKQFVLLLLNFIVNNNLAVRLFMSFLNHTVITLNVVLF